MNLDELNPMQRKAAETLEGPVLILAGAGSGKTKTITYRIANLLEHSVAPWHILALTFTNKAAREMRSRIENLVGEQTEDMWLGTFHSVCVRILRRDIEKLGWQRSFTIYDDDDRLRLIKDCVRQLNLDEKMFPPKDIKNKIADAKNKILSPDEYFARSDKSLKSQHIHDVFCLYEQKLKVQNALDFDDLLLKTVQLFLDHPPVLDFYRNKFRYVHVDEYQDTNPAQYQLVRLLTEESRNLCVVGDDDQSIYGWRGADIRNILDFEQDFPDATIIKLEQNYRSTANILDAANQVIAHNEGRKEKALWTDLPEGDKLRLYAAGDEREEAAWICERIRRLYTASVPYSEMAVLYRMHAQSRVLEEMFMRSGIPYRVFGGTRFYDRKEIKDALAYLRIINNPSDSVSLKRIINYPRRGVGDASIHAIEAEADKQGVSMFSLLSDPPASLTTRARKIVAEFAEKMKALAEKANQLPLGEFVTLVLNEAGLMEHLEHEDAEENQARIDNLKEFMGAACEFERKSAENSLADFLENVALITDLDRQNEDAPQYVTLMTLHSAKGLEFDAVFIAGMEENLFPSLRAINEDNRFEEERRLCYVGITRARKHLFLSYARQRTIFNQISYNAPSCFIREIPERVIEDEWAQAEKLGMSRNRAPARQQPVRARKPASLSFGVPGMGQTPANPLQIPGVTKGLSANAVKTLFQPGDHVLHRKFGEGLVTGVSGKGADARITISFTAYGEKEFSLSIAPIVKINV